MSIDALKCKLFDHDYYPYSRSNVVFHEEDGILYRLMERKCRRCGFRTQEWVASQEEDGDVEIKWKPQVFKTVVKL